MNYEMVVSDVDGTIVNWTGRVAIEVVRAIAELRRSGKKFTLATGRRRKMALEVARDLDIDTPILAYDGACILDVATGQCLSAAVMDYDLYADLVTTMSERSGVVPVIQVDPRLEENIYVASRVDEQKLTSLYPSMVGDVSVAEKPLELPPPVRVLALGELARLQELMADLAKWPGRVAIWTSLPEPILECYAPGIDKGFGLGALCDIVGISPEAVVAVGDDFNDLPLLKRAGLAVAMANARPELHDIADLVCGDVDGEGIAGILRAVARNDLI